MYLSLIISVSIDLVSDISVVFAAVPYPLELTSDHRGSWPFEYIISWEKPKTGGLPIREYEFKFRRVCFSYCYVSLFIDSETWERAMCC